MAILGKVSFALATAVMVVGVLVAPAQAVPVCGPGDHWVDTCGAGLDTFSSSATVTIDFFDATPDLTLVLNGPTSVERSGPRDDSLNFPGLRAVDGHLDVIDTEIVSLVLTGSAFGGDVTLRAGAGLITSGLASRGAISEQPTDPAVADSFFDVFFEIDVQAFGMTLLNENPLRLQALIEEVPPLGIDYVHPLTSPVQLIDQSGALVAQLINAVHTPTSVPEPAALAIFAFGLVGLGFMRRRRTA